MREIKVAIVGCGYVANDHVKAWRKIREARVMAVSDLNKTLAKSTADLWKIPHHYGSTAELMQKGDVNLVDICTPPQTHAAIAVQAMKQGFNVLIEKPMTMTTKDAEQIVECQRTASVKAGVLHNWLFEPIVLEATSIVKRGRLGDLLSVEIEALSTKFDSMAANEHHWSHSLPGGRFSEMLAHPIYLLRHFLGKAELDRVLTSKVGDYPWMKYDELCALFRIGNKLGRAYATFNAPRDAIFISLYGREAIIKLDVVNATMNLLSKRKMSRFGKGLDSTTQAVQLVKSTAKNSVTIVLKRWLSGHDMAIKRFAESLIAGIEPPTTVEEGLATVNVLEKMCRRIEEAEKGS